MSANAATYLAAFETQLRRLGLSDAADIAADVRSHIDEALGYGRSLESVLETLGSPEALARAYAVELLMQPPRTPSNLMRWPRLIALIAFGGVLTLIIVLFLGSVCLGLGMSGLLAIAFGVFEVAGVHSPFVHLDGHSPWWLLVLGPAALAVGLVAGWALKVYVRFAARQITRAIPIVRQSSSPTQQRN